MRFGIIGTGRIACRFIETAIHGFDIQVECVYNPHPDSAARFAKQHGLPSASDDFDAFASKIDAAYVASVHETHYSYVKRLLEAGKHVLCEKPMALSQCGAEELFALANQKHLVLMEAVKTACCQGFSELAAIAASGRIGRIVDIEAAFTRLTPINTREYNAPVYNGSFLEFGSYGMLPVFRLMGTDFKKVDFQSIRSISGVDTYTKAYFEFENGMATVKTGLGAKSEGQLLITGTNGYILAKSPWWMTKTFEVRYEDPNQIERYEYPYEGSGLQYELGVFLEAVKSEMSGDITLKVKEQEREFCVIAPGRDESIAYASVMEQFLRYNTPLWEAGAKKCAVLRQEMPMPKIWAHRGCSMAYPENTLEAFEAAAKIPGITGIELDVQFTADREIVVIHDEYVGRVTDGDGKVEDYTLDQIKKLKINAGQGRYTSIPTLREVLELLKPYCTENGLLINIEFKTSQIRYEGIEQKTYDLIREFAMEQYIVYSSFLPESVALIKKIDPSAKTGMLAVSNEECICYARQTGADALHPYIAGMGYPLPKDMEHMPVRAWNMEEPFFGNEQVFRDTNLDKYKVFGVTEIITNVPEMYLVKEEK